MSPLLNGHGFVRDDSLETRAQLLDDLVYEHGIDLSALGLFQVLAHQIDNFLALPSTPFTRHPRRLQKKRAGFVLYIELGRSSLCAGHFR